MKSIGIICEYNPFHNGHLYHIKKIKETYPDYTIILVMSGNFTQRGDVSILNKWDKTDIALENKIDLVVELPFIFSTQSADIFSKGSIEILNILKVDKIVFGSECNDINILTELAHTQIYNKEYDKLVKKYIDEGINYPTAMSKALTHFNNYKIDSPNDLLGLSYIKEILKQKSNIEPICIKRTNDFHSNELKGNIISASSIRNALRNKKNIKKYVPNNCLKHLKKNTVFTEDYFELLKYKILTSKDLSIYQTVDEGIENRIKKYIVSSKNLNELIENIKTKRYTYNKLNRMFIHILCDFTKNEAKKHRNIEYIRILGFNKIGKNYLNKIKKETNVPIITNFSSIKNEMLSIEFRTTCVYASIFDEENKIKIIESEFKNKPKMKD